MAKSAVGVYGVLMCGYQVEAIVMNGQNAKYRVVAVFGTFNEVHEFNSIKAMENLFGLKFVRFSKIVK